MIEITTIEPQKPEKISIDDRAKAVFDRRFRQKLTTETQTELKKEITDSLMGWAKSLSSESGFKPPTGFDVQWIGVRNWDELKSQMSCANCGAQVGFAEPNCAFCHTGKPHFMLTISETETKSQLVATPIPSADGIPGVLPENFGLRAVGVQDIAECAHYRSCIYCGAPVMITFPSCSHCNMSKPYLEMYPKDQHTDKPLWRTSTTKLIINQGDVPGYDDASEVVVRNHCAGGIYKSAKVDIGINSTIVAANAIEVNLDKNAQAQEIAARHITLGPNTKVGTITVYDEGVLVLDESAQVGELFLGKNVKVEIKGILRPALLQNLKDTFRPIMPGTRTNITCAIPDGMAERLQRGQ